MFGPHLPSRLPLVSLRAVADGFCGLLSDLCECSQGLGWWSSRCALVPDSPTPKREKAGFRVDELLLSSRYQQLSCIGALHRPVNVTALSACASFASCDSDLPGRKHVRSSWKRRAPSDTNR